MPAPQVQTLIVGRHVALATGNTLSLLCCHKYEPTRRWTPEPPIQHEISDRRSRQLGGPTSAEAEIWQACSPGDGEDAGTAALPHTGTPSTLVGSRHFSHGAGKCDLCASAGRCPVPFVVVGCSLETNGGVVVEIQDVVGCGFGWPEPFHCV